MKLSTQFMKTLVVYDLRLIKLIQKFKKNVLKLMLNGMDRGGKDDKTKKDE